MLNYRKVAQSLSQQSPQLEHGIQCPRAATYPTEFCGRSWQIISWGGSMCYPAHDSLNPDSSILINGLAVCQAQIHMYC